MLTALLRVCYAVCRSWIDLFLFRKKNHRLPVLISDFMYALVFLVSFRTVYYISQTAHTSFTEILQHTGIDHGLCWNQRKLIRSILPSKYTHPHSNSVRQWEKRNQILFHCTKEWKFAWSIIHFITKASQINSWRRTILSSSVPTHWLHLPCRNWIL